MAPLLRTTALAALLLALGLLWADAVAAVNATTFGGTDTLSELQTAILAKYTSSATVGAYKAEPAAQALASFAGGALLLAASEAPLSAAQAAKGGGALTLPQTIVTLALVVSGSANVRLTARQVYLIYKGKLRNWSQVPGSGMRGAIVPVAPTKASPDTAQLTRWLYKSGQAAAKEVTAGPWRTGYRSIKYVDGALNIAKYVNGNKRAIGFVQSRIGGAAFGNHEVALQAAGGAFVAPAALDVNALPLGGKLPPAAAAPLWAAFDLAAAAGPAAYPLLSFTYVLAHPQLPGLATTLQLKAFLRFLMAGQSQQLVVPSLHFHPIPGLLIGQNLAAIGAINATTA